MKLMAHVVANDPFELLATLRAYARVVTASWPTLHPQFAQRRARWSNSSVGDLKGELSRLLDETTTSPFAVRVFWKVLPEYTFRGANLLCARDAGLDAIEQLIGLNDYSPELPWNRQAPHYRKDDKVVVERRVDKLDILERQDQPNGTTTFLRTSKVPIIHSNGEVLGLLGAYQTIDAAAALKLQRDRERDRSLTP
jgi:hypothetical protein